MKPPVMRPFMSYYGGKWSAAPYYPEPRHSTIVEPFAGGAGYSLRYPDRNVFLVERNPKVAAVWRYLIGVDPDEILGLPDIGEEGVHAHGLSDQQTWFIGFWLNGGVSSPCNTPSAWARSGLKPGAYWGHRVRERIARQVERIRHWQIIEGDYRDAPNIEATWFVDPPYIEAGRHYPCSLKPEEYPPLASWCRNRPGQTIVCEAEGAKWLPFRPFRRINATTKNGARWSKEVVWLSQEEDA